MPDQKFTVEEFKNYLLKQDSRGDIMSNLSAENILKANEPDPRDESNYMCKCGELISEDEFEILGMCDDCACLT